MSKQQKGKHARQWTQQMLGAVLALGIGSAAQAEMASTKLFESTSLVTAANINLKQLDLSGSGQLTVKLTDLKWPDMLGTLSFTLFDATHVLGSYALGSSSLSGSMSFNVATAGTYYASIFAAPGSGKKGGLYDAQVSFGPAAAPVPLPAAGWFLFSGIAGLAALRPKQKLSQMCA